MSTAWSGLADLRACDGSHPERVGYAPLVSLAKQWPCWLFHQSAATGLEH